MTYMSATRHPRAVTFGVMTRAQKHLIRIAAVFMGLAPALALAHPGHGETSSFFSGSLHPLSGMDHLLGFIAVGVLAAKLGGRYLAPLAAALLGLLVAAWTTDSDGWRYAAGFMLSGAGLVAAAMGATRAATRLARLAFTASAPRSPT
jgi:urease accessory protein